MKLAEGLLLRADLQKRVESLRDRITKNTVVQEKERPAEDPKALLKQVDSVIDELKALVFAINEANITGETASNRSFTEALAERDALVLRHSVIRSAADSVVKPVDRYETREIRWVATVDAAGLQRQVDELASQIREVSIEIQEANWRIDLNGI
jgi:hypothetical protein